MREEVIKLCKFLKLTRFSLDISLPAALAVGLPVGEQKKWNYDSFTLHLEAPDGKILFTSYAEMYHGSDIKGPSFVLSHAAELYALGLILEKLQKDARSRIAAEIRAEKDRRFEAEVSDRLRRALLSPDERYKEDLESLNRGRGNP